MPVTNSDCLLVGYNESQCFLLRIGAMYTLQDKNQFLNWIYVALFHLTYYSFLVWLLPYDLLHTIPMGHMTATFQAMHYYCTMFSFIITSYLYHFNRKSINYCLIIIGKGFFHYEGEEESYRMARNDEIKKKKEYLKKLTNRVMVMVFTAAFAVIFLPSVAELLTRNEPIAEGDPINPYLPIPLVMPWDTFTVSGFLAIYVLLIMVSYNICMQILALSMGYVSLMIIYINQFSILNDSVSKIEERAADRYKKLSGKQMKGYEHFKDPLFQECMIFCLRQNVRHHQVLLKWMKETSRFLGWALLCNIFITSFLLAASGFLITVEDTTILKSLILIQVQIVELLFAYLFCWWGENLSMESSKLPHILYNTPWYYCGTRYNKIMQIMLCNSKPVIPKDPIFKIDASLELYKSILSTGYSYFNLLRNMN